MKPSVRSLKDHVEPPQAEVVLHQDPDKLPEGLPQVFLAAASAAFEGAAALGVPFPLHIVVETGDKQRVCGVVRFGDADADFHGPPAQKGEPGTDRGKWILRAWFDDGSPRVLVTWTDPDGFVRLELVSEIPCSTDAQRSIEWPRVLEYLPAKVADALAPGQTWVRGPDGAWSQAQRCNNNEPGIAGVGCVLPKGHDGEHLAFYRGGDA